MAVTYKKIASVTVGSGGATEIDFQNIPQSGYTDLVVKMSLRDTITGTGNAWQAFDIYFNNSTANRTQRYLFGTGSGTGSGSGTEIFGQAVEGGATANTFANGEMYVTNYTSSSNKSISLDQVTENNATAALQYLTAALWSNSAAIDRITLKANTYGTSFAQHSTATLYGISNS